MTAKEYNKLLLYIKQLPAAPPVQQVSLLGYTGVLISDGVQTMYVFNETITLSEGKNVQAFIMDAGRKTEREILQLAPAPLLREIKGILPEKLR